MCAVCVAQFLAVANHPTVCRTVQHIYDLADAVHTPHSQRMCVAAASTLLSLPPLFIISLPFVDTIKQAHTDPALEPGRNEVQPRK